MGARPRYFSSTALRSNEPIEANYKSVSERSPRYISPSASADSTNPTQDAAPVGGTAAVYKAVAVSCAGAFLFGYHLGILNGPLQQIASDLAFLDNVTLQGLVVSISLAGAAVGSLSGTVLADALGRVRAFIVDAVPLLVGAALCATASSATGILAGRFLVGLGIGLSSALVPLYISEVAPTSMRGSLGSVNQLVICIGILAALVVNVCLPVSAWRTMFWISAIPAALLAAGMLTNPETPAYLSSKGRKLDAEKSAELLWGPSFRGELYSSAASSKLGDVETGKEVGKMESLEEKDESISWGEMLSGSNGKLVAIATFMFVIQQFSGINAIVYFSSSVFRDAGVGSEALASAAVGLVNVLGTVIAASLMDKSGRKQLLTVSLIGQGLSMLIMAVAFVTPALQGMVGTIALVFTILYVLSFALGTGPVPGLLCAELLPTSIRGRGVSMAMGVHWVCNFMLGQLFLPIVTAVGVSQVYCFFAVVCVLGAAFVNIALVETKGRSPEEIAALMK